MENRPWRSYTRWASGVALAATSLLCTPTPSAGAEPVAASLTIPDDWTTGDSRTLAAIPSVPEAPGIPPPGRPPPSPLDPEALADSEPELLGGPPDVETAAPLPPEARPEPPTLVPPGLPIPSYPVVINPPVEALIGYFTARERDRFHLWMTRSGRYLAMIQRIFRERGLPEELAYTAMIESGFSPRAVSRVGAKGMWQFMEATARRYGLTVNRWVDERLDPVKATAAAARYLGDLYGMFGHWFLAQAAYNAGEARVARAIQRARTSDFWALTQTRHLPDETKLFVPQILAATVISQQPARYGFDVTPEPPLEYDEVTVRRTLDFETIATLADVPVDAIRDLNPALLATITPPFGSYVLRLPVGSASRFEAALREAPPGRLPSWEVHRVAKNQSLADIARLYRVTPRQLAEINRLPGGRLRGVSELVVPVVARAPGRGPGERPVAEAAVSGPARDVPREVPREVVVRRGDTLHSIAARHGLRPDHLARWNGMDLQDVLPTGARLRLASP
jgi:membrane-bound lytic murein transglycosylase D